MFFGLGCVAAFYFVGMRYFGEMVGVQSKIFHRFWKQPGKVSTLGGVSALVGIITAFVVSPLFPVILGSVFTGLTVAVLVFLAGTWVMERSVPDGESVKEYALNFKKLMGPMRYYTVGALYTTMLALIVKMALRQMFNIKYIVHTPGWLNANI
jgi:hypothetical protein